MSIKDQLIEYQRKEIKDLKEKITDDINQKELEELYPESPPIGEVIFKKDERIKDLEGKFRFIVQVIKDWGEPNDCNGKILDVCQEVLLTRIKGGDSDASNTKEA